MVAAFIEPIDEADGLCASVGPEQPCAGVTPLV
jgi:hypothetical protein